MSGVRGSVTDESSWEVHLVMIAALCAAAVRLVPLHFLSPLQWDELEFFRATQWIGAGRVPFRDFWEHHTPLGWVLFAPVTWLIGGEGIGAVIAMRWAQVPLWAATFWMLNRWMAERGTPALARWTALTAILASSFFMTAASEYRVDTVGCFLFVAALRLAQRSAPGTAGVLFCLTVFANLRMAPVVAVAALALRLQHGAKANRLFTGGLAALAALVALSAATGSLQPMWQQVWVENRLGDAYAERLPWAFVHRLMTPFGVQLLRGGAFVPAGIDPGGVFLFLAGGTGVVLALRSWRRDPSLAVIAISQIAALTFIASMKFIYNYHFEIVAVLMVPLAAAVIERVGPQRMVVAAIAAVVLCGTVYSSLFRAKELDRAYQDRIMREVHERTKPDDEVWSGVAWAIRREPAYRFWFLPDLARQLVLNGHAEPLRFRRPPGAIVTDHNTLLWMTQVQPELLPYVRTHYLPVWRDLLIPAMNARLLPGSRAQWSVPKAGTYRVHVSAPLARHPWFRQPVRVLAARGEGAARLTAVLGPPAGDPRIAWTIDSAAVTVASDVALREGQVVAARSAAAEPLAVVLVPTGDRVFFRQPPPGVSIDAESPRVTHVPRFGVRIGS